MIHFQMVSIFFYSMTPYKKLRKNIVLIKNSVVIKQSISVFSVKNIIVANALVLIILNKVVHWKLLKKNIIMYVEI